jgi:hypothetical protein
MMAASRGRSSLNRIDVPFVIVCHLRREHGHARHRKKKAARHYVCPDDHWEVNDRRQHYLELTESLE